MKSMGIFDRKKDAESNEMSELDKMVEAKVQLISILQESKIGDFNKLETIKKSLIEDNLFSFESNEYLEEKYSEYEKILKSKEDSKQDYFLLFEKD